MHTLITKNYIQTILYTILFYLNKDWGCVILREIDFLLKIADQFLAYTHRGKYIFYSNHFYSLSLP